MKRPSELKIASEVVVETAAANGQLRQFSSKMSLCQTSLTSQYPATSSFILARLFRRHEVTGKDNYQSKCFPLDLLSLQTLIVVHAFECVSLMAGRWPKPCSSSLQMEELSANRRSMSIYGHPNSSSTSLHH